MYVTGVGVVYSVEADLELEGGGQNRPVMMPVCERGGWRSPALCVVSGEQATTGITVWNIDADGQDCRRRPTAYP